MAPILSICIPTYNRANLLRSQLKTLELALSNISAASYEIVIRDNASTDETQSVIDGFAQNLPISSKKNSVNIGAVRNVLTITEDAVGKYIWLLGDDDLVIQNAFKYVFGTLEDFPGVAGVIVSHAVELDKKRDDLEQAVLAGKPVSLAQCLIRKGVHEKYLNRFEEVFRLTDFPAALNFISNVIFLREAWNAKARIYLAHCESHEEFSDAITVAPHLLLWAEMLVGRPVAIIDEPLVIGFVGNQGFLEKWETMKFVFFLDISKWLLKFGADEGSIRLYQRNIYKDGMGIARLAISEDEYTKKYFSLKKLIKDYGDDELLWQCLGKAIHSIKGRRNKLKFLGKLTYAISITPSQYISGCRILFGEAYRIFRSHFRRMFGPKRKSYPEYLLDLNQEATKYFREVVQGGTDAQVQHPLYLMNAQCLSVGQGFWAGPSLRIEARDKHLEYTYSPKIKMGDRVCFNTNCHIGAIASIEIGNDVLVGSNVLITDHQHGDLNNLLPHETYARQPLVSKGPVVIGDNVWIGENVCIMPGVAIGKNSVIGANSVVTSYVPENSVVAGVPAKIIKSINLSQ